MAEDKMRLIKGTLGVLGILLPIFLPLGACSLECLFEPVAGHVSHVQMRLIFGSFMIFYSVLFLAYRDSNKWATQLASFAGILASLLALTTILQINDWGGSLLIYFELFLLSLFFIILAYFSLFLFRKKKSSVDMTVSARLDNRVYLACGLVMIASVIGLGSFIWHIETTSEIVLLTLISGSLFFSGVSWLMNSRVAVV
jgi:hypothetical protein